MDLDCTWGLVVLCAFFLSTSCYEMAPEEKSSFLYGQESEDQESDDDESGGQTGGRTKNKKNHDKDDESADEDDDAYSASDGMVKKSVCHDPGWRCPKQDGWPSACSEEIDYFCDTGQKCIPNGENGLCFGACDPEEGCPEIPWNIEAVCVTIDELLKDVPACYLVGCETNDDCPLGLRCTGYAKCPDIHTCLEDCWGPNCDTVSACGDAPIEGTICYPDSC